jgi:hypothetical protein
MLHAALACKEAADIPATAAIMDTINTAPHRYCIRVLGFRVFRV